MSVLRLTKDGFYFGQNLFQEEDLFSDEFYKYSDSVCDSYRFDSFLENEVFLYIIQPYLALRFFVQKNQVSSISISGGPIECQRRLIDIASFFDIPVNSPCLLSWKVGLLSYIKFFATAFYILYFLLNIPFSKKTKTWKEFTIIRDKASESKLRRFEIHKETEDIKKKDSVYCLFTKKERIGWVLNCIPRALKGFNNDYRQTVMYVGKNTGDTFLERYSTRILHTYLYEVLIDNLFKENVGNTYYSGLNLERFAIVEDKVAEKYHIKTVCIPHGLEYGYKFPYGFTTQLFYTTSENAEQHLNKLYQTHKFIFDESVAIKMYKVKNVFENKTKRVVFFSEPRDPHVNLFILDKLLPLAENAGIPIYIKHHPGDNLNDYAQFGNRLPVINNLDEAITGNICFARKSTTLIEALYNGSTPAAIITNNKDKSIFETFPSLQDEKIRVFYSVNYLFDWIKEKYNKQS